MFGTKFGLRQIQFTHQYLLYHHQSIPVRTDDDFLAAPQARKIIGHNYHLEAHSRVPESRSKVVIIGTADHQNMTQNRGKGGGEGKRYMTKYNWKVFLLGIKIKSGRKSLFWPYFPFFPRT